MILKGKSKKFKRFYSCPVKITFSFYLLFLKGKSYFENNYSFLLIKAKGFKRKETVRMARDTLETLGAQDTQRTVK